ncbi:hypothetical protein MAJHIDBO_01381 [Propionibacterium freudenreichii subsp. shermanii]|nr:hypothetical protein MAJHIDBO_01381 [Propionibacterium freudenreichii subsp. shermanii]SPS09175.1 hypothetical protein MAJHIDBO_01381 [Propionibacterium freudenreichii subsp. shermanii]
MPTTKLPHTSGLVMPKDPAELMANTKSPRPMVDRATEATSTCGRVIGCTLRRNATETTSDSATSGSISQKIHCQPIVCTTSPDTVGLIAGANMSTRPTSPMALPRRSGG